MTRRLKWSCQRVETSLHPISKKEFEQRLDEVMRLLLNKDASSKNAFSTKTPRFQDLPVSHGELNPVAEDRPQSEERINHDKAV